VPASNKASSIIFETFYPRYIFRVPYERLLVTHGITAVLGYFPLFGHAVSMNEIYRTDLSYDRFLSGGAAASFYYIVLFGVFAGYIFSIKFLAKTRLGKYAYRVFRLSHWSVYPAGSRKAFYLYSFQGLISAIHGGSRSPMTIALGIITILALMERISELIWFRVAGTYKVVFLQKFFEDDDDTKEKKHAGADLVLVTTSGKSIEYDLGQFVSITYRPLGLVEWISHPFTIMPFTPKYPVSAEK
jgi:hypothetical protein